MDSSQSPNNIRLATALLGAAVLTPLAMAQEAVGAGSQRAYSIQPRLTITETFTDNVRLSTAEKQPEQVTEVSPGLRVTMNSARVKGFLDYALTGIGYAQSTAQGRTSNALSTLVTVEAIDNTAFIDFSGSISQQAVSAFGAQSIDNTSINANRSEVSNYRLSPYLKGRIGQIANYEARYSRTVNSNAGAASSGVYVNEASLSIAGASSVKNVGWTANASQQSVGYTLGRSTESDAFRLGLTYAISPQLSVSANAGREANNFASIDKQTNATTGFGLNWSPLETTRLAVAQTHQGYGDSYQVSFDHRTALTAWRFSDNKGVVQPVAQQGTASLGSAYDILNNLFLASEPDPIARASLVNAYLLTYGISPTSSVTTGFFASALTMQRRQDASFSLLGRRDTITFIATQSESSRLDSITLAQDDLSTSAVIRQQSISVNWAHRLAPNYACNVLLSQQATSGTLSTQSSTLHAVNVNLTGKLGKKTTGTLGLRRVDVDSTVTPYTENALIGSVNMQF